MAETEKTKDAPIITGDLETLAKSLPPGCKFLGTTYELQKTGRLPPGSTRHTPEEMAFFDELYAAKGIVLK
jgi:hypothetical protein